MSIEESKALVLRFYEEIWNRIRLMLDVQAVGSDLAHRPFPQPGDGLDEVILAPDLDHRVVHEDVDELSPVGVADREHLVVHRHDAVGRDAAKDPLTGMVLGGIDRD